GLVRSVEEDVVQVMNLETEDTRLGTLAVLQDNQVAAAVGEGLIGRIISPLGRPLDGKGAVKTQDAWPLYNQAPGIMERELLKDQLPTGVTVVDSLFPVVMGQRIAILGDTKSGKSSFLTQLGMNQKDSDRIVIYVLIGKRRVEIDQLMHTLTESGAIERSIVVVANIFDSLAQSYIAPYVGCAIAEYLWHNGRDVVIIYDDLSSHAKVYREVALLSGDNPGRESYPGDMFFAHSSLLERAGKLAKNSKTLTVLPVVITPGDDITAFLPTSIMSITDGQLIFDLASFRQNIRPAVNAGLSVSRVGGRAQTVRQKQLSSTIFKKMAEYRQAAEFAHFGSEIAPETKLSLQLGKQLEDAFRQSPNELFSIAEQELILQTVIRSAGQANLNTGLLKLQAKQLAPSVKTDAEFEQAVTQLLSAVTMGNAA
ncbi:MAG TPA: sodium-transporting two-sector ATPase, partial [Candidatus Saccharimonadales bacterium]|nr:sodium-transporting two-sector ATPase [Candidatus Saccharimonadales bacterium]